MTETQSTITEYTQRPQEADFVEEYGPEKGKKVFGAILGKLHRTEEKERG